MKTKKISHNLLPLAEVTKKALHVLYKEIGIVNTVRFMNQFTTGYGNYTEERKLVFENLTFDELFTEIKKDRKIRKQNQK